MGITNPAHSTGEDLDKHHENNNGSPHNNTEKVKKKFVNGECKDDEDEMSSGCFSQGPSPDSEYDETLAFPDSVTILSMGGEHPILVERREEDDIDSVAMVEMDIPFISVYKPPVKFKSIQRKVFMPGVDIHVEIIDNERSITTHLLNPNL